MKALAPASLVVLLALAAAPAAPAGERRDTGSYRQASFKIAIRGTQVTTWEYRKEKGPDPCDFFAAGEGSQEVTFKTPRFATMVAVEFSTLQLGDRPNLYRKLHSQRPFDVEVPEYTVAATVDRSASTSYVGGAPDCPDRFGGGDTEPGPPDCGERKGDIALWLEYKRRNHLRVSEERQPTLGDLLDLYKRCETHGGTELLPQQLGFEIPADKLFGLKLRKKYDFTDREEKTVSFTPGGTAKTVVRYGLTIRRMSRVRTRL